MKESNLKENRRKFLKTLLPAGSILCLGSPVILEACASKNNQKKFSGKILKKLSFTYEQYFGDKYAYYIGLMKKFSQYLDKETVLSMIKNAVDENNQSMKPNLLAYSVRGLAYSILENETYKTCQDLKTLELTDKVFELKVTNCLWAKTFREMDAADIGYATMCHGDFSSVAAYHPNMKLERTKTLMEGHDCCNHRFIWID